MPGAVGSTGSPSSCGRWASLSVAACACAAPGRRHPGRHWWSLLVLALYRGIRPKDRRAPLRLRRRLRLGRGTAPVAGVLLPDEREFLGERYHDYRGLVQDAVLPSAVGLAGGTAFAALVRSQPVPGCSCAASTPGTGIEPPRRRPRHRFPDRDRADVTALFVPAVLVIALTIARRWSWIPGPRARARPRDRDPRPPGAGPARAASRISGASRLLVRFEVNLVHSGAPARPAPRGMDRRGQRICRRTGKRPRGVLVAGWFAAFFVLASGSLSHAAASWMEASSGCSSPPIPRSCSSASVCCCSCRAWEGGGSSRTPPAGGPRLAPSLAAAEIGLAAYPLLMVALAGPASRDRVVVQQARSAQRPGVERLRAGRHARRRRDHASLAPASRRFDDARIPRDRAGPGCAYRRAGGGDCPCSGWRPWRRSRHIVHRSATRLLPVSHRRDRRRPLTRRAHAFCDQPPVGIVRRALLVLASVVARMSRRVRHVFLWPREGLADASTLWWCSPGTWCRFPRPRSSLPWRLRRCSSSRASRADGTAGIRSWRRGSSSLRRRGHVSTAGEAEGRSSASPRGLGGDRSPWSRPATSSARILFRRCI